MCMFFLCQMRIITKNFEGQGFDSSSKQNFKILSECWTFGQNHIRKMGIAEIRMLRWTSLHTLTDRILNEDIIKGLRVANIEKKMKGNHLRWFGHVQDGV